MTKLTRTAAFARFGAELTNPQWACSSIADDGSMVITCWGHWLKKYVDGHQRYEDQLSRWDNKLGENLLRKHLQLALDGNLKVRQVLVALDDPRDPIATSSPKTYSTNGDLVGKVVSFDGDTYVLEFYRK
jgi:hypothetical protein